MISLRNAVLLCLCACMALTTACDREGTPKGEPASPVQPGPDGVPRAVLSDRLAVLEDARVEGLLAWDGSVIVRRADGHFRVDAGSGGAARLSVPELAKVQDLAVSGGRSYVLGQTADSDRPLLRLKDGVAWSDVPLPKDLRISAGLWLAGGSSDPILVTPFEAYRRVAGKWVDYRFQDASARYREGSKFYVGDRLYVATRLGITGGEVRAVDLATTPRVWRRVELPAHYQLTAIAQEGDSVLWAAANRTAGGMNRSVLLRGEAGGGRLEPLAGVAFGEPDRSWPSILGLSVAPGSGELLVLLSTGIMRFAPGPEGSHELQPVARFDFGYDLFLDLARDPEGDLYFATEYSGVYQLRLRPDAGAELRRIRFQP